MRINVNRLAALSVPILLGFGASGCGGRDASSTTTSTSGGSTPTMASPHVTADQAIAQAANLTLADFPAGWTAKTASQTSSGGALQRQMDACLHTSSILQGPTTYQSPLFSNGKGNSARSAVQYDARSTRAQSDIDVVSGSSYPACATAAANSVIKNPGLSGLTLPPGASIGDITVVPEPFPMFADKTAAFRVTIPVSVSGVTVKIYTDMVAIQDGRAFVEVEFGATKSPFNSAEEERLAGDVVRRLSGT